MRRRDFITGTAFGLVSLAAGQPGRSRAKEAKYKVAVIGRTGRGNYGHGLDVVWNDIEQAEVVAVADEDPQGREAAAKRLKAPKSYAYYRRMLGTERPQIVSVAPRWPDCHHDMVLACAEFDCHIFLEKPVCQNLEQADAIIAALEKRNLKLAIAHQTRYSPALMHAQMAIGEGLLGDILELRGRGKEDRRGGGEDLVVLGTHVIDLMRFFAGDAKWCFASVRDNREPEVNQGILDCRLTIYKSKIANLKSQIITHRARHGVAERFGLQVYGSRGILTTTTGAVPEIWFVEDPSWQPGCSKAHWKRIKN
ncbi:MAG: Gfo/Idh/MocA family oxidoreductase [Sedimentisphaerales bacterium]|nr:Gfo/Idh/MocA family oxidoreductase [Sedimentisphaerales bacterium]